MYLNFYLVQKSPRGQRPTRSLKAMGTNIPAAGPGEAILPADVSPTQAKAVSRNTQGSQCLL